MHILPRNFGKFPFNRRLQRGELFFNQLFNPVIKVSLFLEGPVIPVAMLVQPRHYFGV
jgi:hypothetical protein